jgi:hypothetical protein
MRLFIFLIFVTLASAEIHNLITSLYDMYNTVETSMREQYNNFASTRLNTINGQMAPLKKLSCSFQQNVFQYQFVDEGNGIFTTAVEYISVVRKNVFYSLKSAIDDLRNDNLNILFQFQQYNAEFVEKISQLSKNLFAGGKKCVLLMEPEIQGYFDNTLKKLMDAMKGAANTNSLAVQSVRTQTQQLQQKCQQLFNKNPFNGIQIRSTKESNETVANNYNAVRYFLLLIMITG